MARIEKKIWPESFARIIKGDKRYEVRLADFECNTGDILILKEWDPKQKEYTGNKIEKEIKDVRKVNGLKFYTKEDLEKYGLQIIEF